MKKKIAIVLAVLALLILQAGCDRQATIVSRNIGIEADEFKITRRITVVNMRTDSIMFEIEGTMSLQNNSSNELQVICMVGDGIYKKHFIYLNDWTSYVVEDVSGADVDPYHYHIDVYPFRGPVLEIGVP